MATASTAAGPVIRLGMMRWSRSISATGTSTTTSTRPRIRSCARVLGQDHGHGEHRGQRLDDRVARRYRLTAPPAASAQQQPAQHGDVVVGPDRRLAARAVRAGMDQGLPPGQPVGHHVQERARRRRPGSWPELAASHTPTGTGSVSARRSATRRFHQLRRASAGTCAGARRRDEQRHQRERQEPQDVVVEPVERRELDGDRHRAGQRARTDERALAGQRRPPRRPAARAATSSATLERMQAGMTGPRVRTRRPGSSGSRSCAARSSPGPAAGSQAKMANADHGARTTTTQTSAPRRPRWRGAARSGRSPAGENLAAAARPSSAPLAAGEVSVRRTSTLSREMSPSLVCTIRPITVKGQAAHAQARIRPRRVPSAPERSAPAQEDRARPPWPDRRRSPRRPRRGDCSGCPSRER